MGTQSPPEATLEGGDGRPHVLVVPYPAQGHMLALLDLAALLATRGDLSVTVAVTTGNVALLDPLLAACPSVGVVTLPFPSSPFLPPGCAAENTRELPYHLFRMFLPALAALRAPLLAWCQAQARRVTAVVSPTSLRGGHGRSPTRSAQVMSRSRPAAPSTSPCRSLSGAAGRCRRRVPGRAWPWRHAGELPMAPAADDIPAPPGRRRGIRGDPSDPDLEPGVRVHRRQLLRGP
ncbi:unnamed protein product [Urochloa humidicola]